MTKANILSEIQRTAALINGGKPVGRLRFTAETGIRGSDWRGIHWVRWNQALEEAGFQPNQLTTGLSDEEKSDLLVGLVRELGHFPVVGEIKMKSRSSAEFPTEKSFRHFGGKQKLATRLLRHSVERGYEDIDRLCTPFAEPTSDGLSEDADLPGRAPVAEEIGFVYMMKAGKFFKIGRTNALGRRHRELAIQLPEQARVVHSIETDDPVGIEEYWHRRFHERRKNGEWFELSMTDVAVFRRRKFM